MQLTAYLFNPEIPARFNRPNTVRNTVTWNKPLKVYRGADNYIDIVMNDFDLQPVVVNTYTFKFKVKDRHQHVHINKTLTFRAGSTNRLALDILKEDTYNMPVGLYDWGLSIVDERNRERPIYLEVNGDAVSTFELLNWFAGAGYTGSNHGYNGSGYCGSGYTGSGYTGSFMYYGPLVNADDRRQREKFGNGYTGSGFVGSFAWDPLNGVIPYWNLNWGAQPYWNPQWQKGTYWSLGFSGSAYNSQQWRPIWGPLDTPYVGYVGSQCYGSW